MRWDNFARFSALHLQLGRCLDWHIGPLALSNGGSHPNFTLQSWVEQQVDFVAVKPFTALDLSAGNQAADNNGEVRSTVYTAWHHIATEELPFSRLRSLGEDDGTSSVQQLIDHLVGWHGEYWAKQPGNPPLVLDAIVRHTRRTPPGETYYHESLEFFLVPDDAQPMK